MTNQDQIRVALEALKTVIELAVTKPDGTQYAYLETRHGSFIHVTDALKQAEVALSQPAVDEREMFERWAQPDSIQAKRNPDGSYADYGMAAGWAAWQARATIASMSREALKSVAPGLADLMPASLSRPADVRMAVIEECASIAAQIEPEGDDSISNAIRALAQKEAGK
jgi:hypothetical protein